MEKHPSAASSSSLPAVFFLVILLVISAGPAVAQESHSNFERISIEQGLSQSSVNCITQDHSGYIWIGTADGLNRYDGYSFKIFRNDPAQKNSISDNAVTAMHVDAGGRLLIGTLLGHLNIYNAATDEFSRISLEKILPQPGTSEPFPANEYPLIFARYNENTITSVYSDSKGILWLGTWGRGLIRYDLRKNDYQIFSYSPSGSKSISSNRIVSLMGDSKNNLWVCTFGGGLDRITLPPEDGSGKLIAAGHYNKENSRLNDNRVMSLIEDRSGFIWAGTYGGGITKINPSDGSISRYTTESRSSLGSNRVMKLLQDRAGQIWIATFGGGITRLDPATGAAVKYVNDPMDPGSISDNDIISMYEDRTGIIWIGTHLGKGINRYDGNRNKFTHFRKIPGSNYSLNDDVVWSFAEDKDGSIWIGTYRGGLNRFDKKSNRFSHIKKSPGGLSSNHIRALFFDRSGRLWIGTYDAGISIYDKKTGRFTTLKNDPASSGSLSNNQVLSIIQDRSGNIWAGTFGGGLNKLAGDGKNGYSFIRYNQIPGNPNALSDNRVYTLLEDRSGFIWIGTFGGGLCRLDPQTGSVRTYSNDPQNPESLSENRVLTLHEDKSGTIWVGTFGGGLNSLDVKTGKFKRYSQEGYHSNVIYGILEDAGGYLWLSTDNGLMKMRKADSHFISYDLHDGVQSMEFSGGAYLKTSKGEMYFGGINGFNSFYPDLIVENTYIPPIVISSFKIFNKEISGAKDKIVLENRHNFFTFEFAALDYTNSEQNHYAYKLEGFDNEWHYTDASRRIASYTNLDPGNYTFRVRGSNNDGYWNEKGIEVAIQILPPFYLTWWFITLAILLTAGTVTYFIAGQIRHLLAIERLKGKLAADLHDSVGSGLTEISILSEVIAARLCDAPDDVRERLKNINETSGFLIDNMSDIVWVVNPVRDTLHDLILRLRDAYADIFSSLGISFKVNNLELLRSVKLPMEHKQNLYLIFKEGINNCLKHSSCTALLLDAKLHGRKLEISLKDNGKGFNLNKNSQGNGLINIKKRARSIGGHLVIESAPGQGTLIKFTGNVPRFRSFILRHTE